MINDNSSQQAASLIIEEALQQAIAQHQAGQLLEAEQLYRGILQLQPHHAEANHNLGVLEVQEKRPAAGLAYLMAALEAEPAHGQYWLSYIDALYQDGQIEAAREALELSRQQGLEGNGVTQLALLLAEGEQAVELSNQDTGSGTLADALFAPKSVGKKLKAGSGWPAKSAKKSAPYPTRNPDTNEFNKLLALFSEGNYAAAASLAQKMTMRFPQHGFGWMLLGASLQQMGRSADALAPMKKALSLTPGDAAAHCNMGAIYNDLGRLEEAEACYLQALKISPDYAMAYSNLGNTQHEMGRLFEAEASYRRALAINPDYAEANSNLSITLQQLGRHDEAEASYRRALEINPEFAEAHSNLGKTLQDMGRLDESESSYRRALAINPDYAEAHSNLGNTLQAMGRFLDAEASYRRALEIAPDYAEACSNLGLTLQGLGRLDEAEAGFRRALAIKPESAEAHSYLGDILQQTGRLEAAAASYRQALQIQPDHKDALLNLGHLLCYLDDLVQAGAVYKKILDIDHGTSGMDARVNLAILHYLDGQLDQCRGSLHASQPIMATTDARHKNHRNYWCYLDKLLSRQETGISTDTSRDGNVLHVMGDSHTLAAHGVAVRYKGQDMRCETEWIAGCKQWHLGNASENKYKHKFEKVMARLPENSTVLLMVGEIDCRHDEGVLKAWKKYPDKTLDEVVESTVEAYLAYVAKTGARYGHKIIVAGVPATNIRLDALAEDSAAQLVQLIRLFNAAIQQRTLAAGMGFLDVYALTDRGDGIASADWHIDEVHLQSEALAEAFERYCLHH